MKVETKTVVVERGVKIELTQREAQVLCLLLGKGSYYLTPDAFKEQVDGDEYFDVISRLYGLLNETGIPYLGTNMFEEDSTEASDN